MDADGPGSVPRLLSRYGRLLLVIGHGGQVAGQRGEEHPFESHQPPALAAVLSGRVPRVGVPGVGSLRRRRRSRPPSCLTVAGSRIYPTRRVRCSAWRDSCCQPLRCADSGHGSSSTSASCSSSRSSGRVSTHGEHPAVWEKKGANLFTVRNVTWYRELRVSTNRLRVGRGDQADRRLL